eukprot:Gb_17394 [translate_table: standard]
MRGPPVFRFFFFHSSLREQQKCATVKTGNHSQRIRLSDSTPNVHIIFQYASFPQPHEYLAFRKTETSSSLRLSRHVVGYEMAPRGELPFHRPRGPKVDLTIAKASQWNPQGPKPPEILTCGVIPSPEPTADPIHENAGKKGSDPHLKGKDEARHSKERTLTEGKDPQTSTHEKTTRVVLLIALSDPCRVVKRKSRARQGTVAIITGPVFQDLYKMLRPNMVYDAETAKAFLKGRDLVKGVLKDWAENPDTFKRRAHLDYPISHFRKGIKIGMLLLNKLWEEADTDQVNQLWVLLLGEIILNDRKLDLAKVLAYNLHKNWEVAESGTSFFMASYIVDACCAYLDFRHPLFPEWPNLSGAPIHVLFSALYIYQYRQHITPICDCFYPVVHKAICGVEMPKITEGVRRDLSQLGACWFFEEFTYIKVEGTLTRPSRLPVHIPDRLVALEVAKQCNYGVAKRCKLANQRPYPYLPFTIGALHDSVSVFYHHQPSEEEDLFNLCPVSWEEVEQRRKAAWRVRSKEAEPEETDETLTKQLLNSSVPPPPHVAPQGTTTNSQANSSISPPNTPSTVRTSDVATPPITSPSVTSPITTSTTTVPSSPSQSSTTVSSAPSISPSFESPVITTKGEDSPVTREALTINPLNLSGGIRLPPSLSLKPTIWRSPTFTILAPVIAMPSSTLESTITTSTPRSSLTTLPSTKLGRAPLIDPIDGTHLEDAQSATPPSTVSKSQWIQMQLAKAEEVGSATPKPPEVILEYDKATSSLKRVTKRKIRIEDQDRDRIMALPSIDTEITGSIKDLYRCFVQVEEARGRGEETHCRIGAYLKQINEWDSKLATLGSVARRNLLPNLSLLELDEVITYENVLAKTRQALEDGDVPLVSSNRQLESSSHNIMTLLDSAGLPLVVKPNNSFPSEVELDATLGEFTTQFARQLASVEEQGNQALHKFVVGVARKVERPQCVKEFLGPILAEHTRIASKVAS